ncbi:MAG TPA: hypothetical protein VFN61_07695 [Acidimicrobiales bacterium]|nr:hypothetical protein [Acidimicrobiales bacterium]
MTYQAGAFEPVTEPHEARPRRRRQVGAPLAGVLVVAGLAGGLSGCSTAPAAAVVNGQKISVQQLDQQMSDWASSPDYRLVYDQNSFQQAQRSGNQNPQGVTVEGAGTGSGVYGRQWASTELTLMIDATAIHQYLAAHHEAPTSQQVAAAWASEEAAAPQLWQQLSPQTRTQAAEQDAQAALVYGKPVSVAADQQFYAGHEADFWSQVCLARTDVVVSGANGNVDNSASKRQADSEAKAWSGTGSGSGAPQGAAQSCYSGEQLLERGVGYFRTVSSLPVGGTAAIPAQPGYQVVKVLSRQTLPFAGWDATVIELVSQHNGNHFQFPIGEGGIDNLVNRANVSVNIAYGAWTYNGQYNVSYVNFGSIH